MFQNYFMTATRNLLRNKVYALINICGLAIGLATCLLLLLYVSSEVGFDKNWTDSERIYRMESQFTMKGEAPFDTSYTPGPVMPLMQKDFDSQIEASSRFMASRFNVIYEDFNVRSDIIMSDPGFIDVFNIDMALGNAKDAFRDNNSIVISERQAERIFGSENPLEKIITIDMGSKGQVDFKVVGVMNNLTDKTHLEMEFLILLDPERFINNPWVLQWWQSHNIYSYMKLAEGVDPQVFEKDFPAFLDRHFDPMTTQGMDADPGTKASDVKTLNLIPLQDIYLYSSSIPQLKEGGDHIQIKILSSIAFAILFIAIINFTNLTNARALRRLKEIAIRKVQGAMRIQLMFQFIGEAIGVATLALLVALPLVELSAPLFSDLVGKEVIVSTLFSNSNLIYLSILIFFTGCLGGFYPALLLSKSRPSEILAGSKGGPTGGQKIRSFLVVTQFAVSIALTVMTLIVFAQTKYLQERDIGINTENRLIAIGMHTPAGQKIADAFSNQILDLPGVEGYGLSNRMIPINGGHNGPGTINHKEGSFKNTIENTIGDYSLLEVLGAELLAGRFFSEEFSADLKTTDENGNSTGGVIITDFTAKSYGFKNIDDAIGQILTLTRSEGITEKLTIVGVVKNMNLRSARRNSENLIFKVNKTDPSVLNIKLSGENNAETVQQIENIWNELLPEQPLISGMMDEQFRGFYADDEQQAKVFGYSALLSILISTIGLFGLAALTAESRTKEIGIRKVLGAQIWDIVKLMVWQFSKPVVLANLIGWPIAWFLMGDWLNGFVFRIDMTPIPFLLAGLGAAIVAWVTIGAHAWRVARANPINALRYE